MSQRRAGDTGVVAANDALVVVLRFIPAPGRRDDLLAAVSAGVRRVHQVRGCLLYTLREEDDGALLLIEKWASRDDLDAFLASPLADELIESYEGLLAAPPQPTIMPVRAADPEAAADRAD
jgi:quinol monooxygenase YgiN